eukprot:scaffold48693_cov208-Isochrysis_galbana.AAC.1
MQALSAEKPTDSVRRARLAEYSRQAMSEVPAKRLRQFSHGGRCGAPGGAAAGCATERHDAISGAAPCVHRDGAHRRLPEEAAAARPGLKRTRVRRGLRHAQV